MRFIEVLLTLIEICLLYFDDMSGWGSGWLKRSRLRPRPKCFSRRAALA
jgi:hypothetical protein